MISIISRTYWPATTGGAEKYIHELKNQLSKQHKFKIYSWNKSKDKDLITIKVPKVKVIGSAIFSYKACKEINKDKSSLVHISQYWSEYSSFFLKKRFVSTIYDLPTNPAHKFIVKHCALKSKKVFYISNLIKNQLMNYGVREEDLVYTPPGIDDSIRKKRRVKKTKEWRFFHMSRIAPNKDLITIIKALGLLKGKYKFKLYVAGQKMEWTNYYQKVINEIKKQGLSKQVMLLGRVNEKQRLDLLHSADAYLHASTYGEGFGIPIVEAQAASTPVIATKLFSDIGIVRDKWNGLIFSNKNHNQLSNKIIELMKDDVKRKKLIKNGLKFSQKFDWKNSFKNVSKVYKELT